MHIKQLIFTMVFLTMLAARAEVDWVDITPNYSVRFAVQMKKPRMLTLAPDGSLLITSASGRIYRSRPPFDSAEVWTKLPGYPHGIVVREGVVYVATTTKLWRAEFEPQLKRKAFKKVNDLPGTARGHSSRTLGLSPENEILLTLGIKGNCSDEWVGQSYESDRQRGGFLKLDEQNNQWIPFASGLRNPVGFTWHPQTGKLYATNNGPDHWGYERPKEVMVEIEQGDFFGMPWFQRIDDKLVSDSCIDSEPPLAAASVKRPFAYFEARTAPMGIDFYDLNGDGHLEALVALHGSWGKQPNKGRESRRHPKIVQVDMKTGRVSDFITGFQRANGNRFARPVGVLSLPNRLIAFTSDSGEFEGLFIVEPKL